jgi:hypothetical protein
MSYSSPSYYQSAFSQRLGKVGFDIHKAITIDFLHEVELGVWKALFTHLVRMLQSKNKNLVLKLDERRVANSILVPSRSFSLAGIIKSQPLVTGLFEHFHRTPLR